MKNIELLNKLAGTLPGSSNGVFWDDDVLCALEKIPMSDEFSGDTYIGLLEEFLPKIEMDFEDRAEDYAYDLWKLGDMSNLAESNIELKNIINYMGNNNFFNENDIDKHTIELRVLINKYKEKRE